MDVQILDKIKRNLDSLGIAATRGATTITVTTSNLVISYVDADINAPLGGVDSTITPFLGIGIASPGQIKMKGASGENTIAAIFTDEANLRVWSSLGNFANDKVLEEGDSTTQLALIEGHPDLVGMGQ